MIDLFLKALDRLIDLLRISEHRRRARFQEIHQPTYEDLRQVHTDYMLMFHNLRVTLQQGIDDPARAQEVMLGASSFLAERRVPFEPVRDRLVVLLDLLDDTDWQSKFSAPEQQFIQSAANYSRANQRALWRRQFGPHSAASDLLMAIDRAIAGHNPHFDIETVCSATAEIISDLRLNWKLANISFNKLKLEVLSGVTS